MSAAASVLPEKNSEPEETPMKKSESSEEAPRKKKSVCGFKNWNFVFPENSECKEAFNDYCKCIDKALESKKCYKYDEPICVHETQVLEKCLHAHPEHEQRLNEGPLPDVAADDPDDIYS